MATAQLPSGMRLLGLSARLRDMGGGRGGPRQPRNPAPVSNPGSGRRTDGGAGSKSQPLRVPTGGAYGEAGALKAQQQAAPLAAEGPTGGTGAPAPPIAQDGGGGAFGPTQRPNEPNTAGLSARQINPAAASPQAALRVIYANFPHPAIARLIDWTSTAPSGNNNVQP